MPPNIATIPNLPTLEEVRTEKARRSLRSFVEQAWPIVEPGTSFTAGWHIDALCAHLEAVSNGDIKNLLINIPPRHAKSLTVSVFWPVWEWITRPHERYLFNSYADTLSIRDSLKCRRIILSEWYQKRWGHIYKLTSDQNVKSRFENDRTGYRISSSVGGSNTGEGGSRIVCLSHDTKIKTNLGDLSIGDIVDNRISCMVLSMNTDSGLTEWDSIDCYEKSHGSPSVQATFSDGRTLEGTSDHPVYESTGKLKQLSKLSPGSGVVIHANNPPMQGVRETSNPSTLSYAGPQYFLHTELPIQMGGGAEQPQLAGWPHHHELYSLRQDNHLKTMPGYEARSPLLLTAMPIRVSGKPSRTFLDSRQREVSLSTGVSRSKTVHQEARPSQMSRVCIDSDRSPISITGASHRLQQEEQFSSQSDNSLPEMPLTNKRLLYGQSPTMADVFLTSITTVPTPEFVYNIRVTNNHNYFANGILVHNCDDPHNVMEGESDVKRNEVLRWWDEVMSTRLNDEKTGRRVIVMQRVHYNDLSGHLLDHGGWHHLCLPAEYSLRRKVSSNYDHKYEIQPHDDCPIYSDPRTDEGQLLWPERIDKDTIARLKLELGPFSSAGQLQQRPTPREGVLFKVDMFRPLPLDFDTPDSDGHTMRSSLTVGTAVDLAWSEKESADNTASVTGGIDKSGNIYLLNAWRVKADEVKLATELAHHLNATNPSIAGIEQSSYTKTATVDLIRRINTLLIRGIPILAVPVKGDKYTRAQLPAGRGQVGMLYADTSAPWWPAFLSELLDFPKGAHDDWVDALSLLVQLLVEKVGVKPLPPNSEYGFNETTIHRKNNWVSRAIASQEVKIIRRGRRDDDATTTRDDTEGR